STKGSDHGVIRGQKWKWLGEIAESVEVSQSRECKKGSPPLPPKQGAPSTRLKPLRRAPVPKSCSAVLLVCVVRRDQRCGCPAGCPPTGAAAIESTRLAVESCGYFLS